MDLKQLVTVGDSQSPSSSQLWFHIINIAILAIYLFIGYKVGMLVGANALNASQLIDSIVLFTLVVSGIITSNKFANMLVNLKYGNKNDNTIKPS